MEDEIIVGEGENLNSEIEAKTTFSLEEVEAMKKELQSNSDKGVQKVIAERKIFSDAMDEIKIISQDPKRLVELADENPKVANIILEKYGYDDIEAYKTAIEYEEDYTDPKIIQKHIKEEAKALAESEKIQTKKEEFIEKLKMTNDEKKSFEESFEELKGLKSFNSGDLTKQFEKAYRLSNDSEESNRKLKESETIGKAMTIGDGKRGSSGEKPSDTMDDQIQAFKKKHKIT